jgi:hypothetical protein
VTIAESCWDAQRVSRRYEYERDRQLTPDTFKQ